MFRLLFILLLLGVCSAQEQFGTYVSDNTALNNFQLDSDLSYNAEFDLDTPPIPVNYTPNLLKRFESHSSILLPQSGKIKHQYGPLQSRAPPTTFLS